MSSFNPFYINYPRSWNPSVTAVVPPLGRDRPGFAFFWIFGRVPIEKRAGSKKGEINEGKAKFLVKESTGYLSTNPNFYICESNYSQWLSGGGNVRKCPILEIRLEIQVNDKNEDGILD
ncbi:hypothetical protein BB561_000013 [Smittium simulii]|uniref:Uncharacterized protein n=1 Tax=Smittium simulii TaxID=133385 RepID=A0A2T9Z112_9FUNG|nr:hypothetical protein BB561_000013 [Smittium simulii]